MAKPCETLRILLLTTDIGLGGAERVWNEHSVAFSKYFHVEQAVFEIRSLQPGHRSNLPLHELVICPFILRLGSLARLFQRVFALRRLVQNRKYDLVISHLEGANLVNVLSYTPAKKILVLHGSAQGDLNHKPFYKFLRLRFLMPFIYSKGDAVVGVSSETANEIMRFAGINDVHSIPNFFNHSAIERKARMPLPDEFSAIFGIRRVLITSGRLAKQKNQSFLFMILKELKLRMRDVCLVIMGDGELRHALIDLASNHQLTTFSSFEDSSQIISADSDVYFVGYQENPFSWLANSDIFLFPSLWEGHPLALCEALICNIPIISTDCPNGPREIIAPNEPNEKTNQIPIFGSNGVLMPMSFDVTSAKMWADVIEYLISHPYICQEMVSSGRSYAQSLSSETILPRWLDLIAKTTRQLLR